MKIFHWMQYRPCEQMVTMLRGFEKIREDSRGAPDDKILLRAQEENRIVLTFDKDFGELAFRSKLPRQSGVILFRITPISSEYIAQVAVQALASQTNWAGQFSVVEDKRIRMTPLAPE